MNAVIIVKPGWSVCQLAHVLGSMDANEIASLRKARVLHPDPAIWRLHYAPHKGKDFFERLVGYMSSGPVAAMIVEVNHNDTTRLKIWRDEIRDKYKPFTHSAANIIHASDGYEDALRETILWNDLL